MGAVGTLRSETSLALVVAMCVALLPGVATATSIVTDSVEAARVSVGSVSLRTYPSRQGRTSAGKVSLRADVDAAGVYQLTLIAGESGVIVDRIEFRRQ